MLLTVVVVGPASPALAADPPPAPSADISVVATDEGPVTQGGTIRYALTVTNHGPDAAPNTVVGFAIPAGTTFVSGSEGCGPQRTVVYCGAGTVPNGVSGTFHVVLRAEAAGKIEATAAIRSSVDDPNLTDNRSSDMATVNGASVDFGSLVAGTVGEAQTVPVATEGTAVVTALSVGGTNASDFPITAQNCMPGPPPAGFFCDVDLRFTPKAAGSYSATLTVYFADGPPVTVPLVGAATQPVATPSPRLPDPVAAGAPFVATGKAGNQAKPGLGGAVSCHARSRKVICTARFAATSSETRFVASRISRGGVTYAYGKRASRSRSVVMTLRRKRRLRSGRYSLTLTVRNGKGQLLSTKSGTLRITAAKR
jgi:uncharacterized repeat protein (TIGR01451 family)